MDSLYRDNILDHYRNPRHFGRLEQPDAKVDDDNPSCGDKIGIEIKTDGLIIEEIAFHGEGCAISLASASMLTEYVDGKTLTEVVAIQPQQLFDMLGVTLTPTRVKCALLSLEVLHKTIAALSSRTPLAEKTRDAV